jgi:hypothetical protein
VEHVPEELKRCLLANAFGAALPAFAERAMDALFQETSRVQENAGYRGPARSGQAVFETGSLERWPFVRTVFGPASLSPRCGSFIVKNYGNKK